MQTIQLVERRTASLKIVVAFEDSLPIMSAALLQCNQAHAITKSQKLVIRGLVASATDDVGSPRFIKDSRPFLRSNVLLLLKTSGWELETYTLN